MPRSEVSYWDTYRHCDSCDDARADVVLAKKRSTSGTWGYLWWCRTCEHHAHVNHRWIAHAQIQAWIDSRHLPADAHEMMPTLSDGVGAHVCLVCESPAVEFHHWAPQSLARFFEEPQRWEDIGGHLCKKHHDEWHEIVTFYLNGRGTSTPARLAIRRNAAGVRRSFQAIRNTREPAMP